MKKLPRDFFDRDTVLVARELLGQHIVRVLPDGTPLVCRITETEAYVGPVDKACHAYGYRYTPRNATMFARPGTAYVYLIYGMHHCLNLVTEQEGEPCAVLLRGAQPVKSADIISNFRFGCKCREQSPYQKKHFLDGPGKLCQGLALTRAQDGLDLLGNELYLSPTLPPDPAHIRVGKRIGIDYAQEAADFPWRFWLEE